MEDKIYCVRKWLNKQNKPSTGSVITYYGDIAFDHGISKTAFIEIADCHGKIRLHVTPTDSMADFVEKLELLKSEIENFIIFLKKL